MCEIIIERVPETVNVVINDGQTPLHIAAPRSNKEIFELIFIKAPEAVDAIATYGLSTFRYAAQAGNSEIMIQLIDQHPILYNFSTESGYALLHLASNSN